MNSLRNRWKIKLSLVTVVMLLAAILGPTSALAAADSFTVSQKFPFDFVVFIPCAAGGAGEDVELTGNLHDLFSITFDGNGGFHLTQLDNPQGISGYGSTTGVKYQATGETRDSFNGMVGFEETYVNNFKIIGMGTGNNYLIHENYHITVNANGTLTAYIDNFSAECR